MLCAILSVMSTSPEHVNVPEWDLADRLAKALREARMSVNEMALYLGVHRNTVSAWVNGRTPISGPAIRAWADRTGVSYDWLRDGDVPTPPRPPAHPANPSTQLPRPVRLPVRTHLVAVEDGTVNEDAARYVALSEDWAATTGRSTSQPDG